MENILLTMYDENGDLKPEDFMEISFGCKLVYTKNT